MEQEPQQSSSPPSQPAPSVPTLIDVEHALNSEARDGIANDSLHQSSSDYSNPLKNPSIDVAVELTKFPDSNISMYPSGAATLQDTALAHETSINSLDAAPPSSDKISSFENIATSSATMESHSNGKSASVAGSQGSLNAVAIDDALIPPPTAPTTTDMNASYFALAPPPPSNALSFSSPFSNFALPLPPSGSSPPTDDDFGDFEELSDLDISKSIATNSVDSKEQSPLPLSATTIEVCPFCH